MPLIKALLGFLSIFLALVASLVISGLIIGSILHALIRSLDLGTSLLVGTISTGFAANLFYHFVSSAYRDSVDPTMADLDDLPGTILRVVEQPKSRRKRNPK